MPDYALMNQCIYEGKAKDVEQMTKDALAEGRHFKEVLEQGLIAGMSVVARISNTTSSTFPKCSSPPAP
jgi:5-methyltetrahydrofolate--homocysteine methyltransferase